MIIAVIGTGTLGPEIAQVFAQCESVSRVVLCKGRDSSVHDGKEHLIKNLEKMVNIGRMTKEAEEKCLAKIVTGTKDNAKDADFLIEAVTEDLEIKRALFRDLDRICKETCVFATNTSSLPIKTIGEGLSRPLTGMHFFNPAPVMKLVEIITTSDTPQSIIDYVVCLAKEIGKTPILVSEAPGFVVNRILIPMINEAVGIFAEGVAAAKDIDTAMVLGANQPMGPLALGDLIGWDVVLAILNVMLKETGDPKYIPQPLIKRMVREKKLGRKTGEGFYKYK